MSEPGDPIEEPGPGPTPTVKTKWFGPSGECGLSCACLPVSCLEDDGVTVGKINPSTVTMILTEPGTTDIKFGAEQASGHPTFAWFYLRISDLSALLGNYVLQRNKETESFHCDTRQSVTTININVDVWGIESFLPSSRCPDVESYITTVTATATVTALFGTYGSGTIKNFGAVMEINISVNYEYVTGSFVLLRGDITSPGLSGGTVNCNGGVRSFTVQPGLFPFVSFFPTTPCAGYISTAGLSLAYSFEDLCDV